MAAKLTLVPIVPFMQCMPWRLRGFEDEPVHGGCCCYCGHDVAVPERARGKTVACLYCCLDRGLIAAAEGEPGEPWCQEITSRRGA